MHEGGFDNPRGKFSKPEDKGPKDLVMPLLNRQILEAVKTLEDETVKIDGVPCQNFLCVGQVIECSVHNNQFVLSVDDGTEVIKIMCLKVFNQEKPKVLEKVDLTKKPYVQVMYQMGVLAREKKEVVVFHGIHFKELVDHNQIGFHILNSLLAQQKRKTSKTTENTVKKASLGPSEGVSPQDLQTATRILAGLKSDGFRFVSKDALLKKLFSSDLKPQAISEVFKVLLSRQMICPISTLEDEYTIMV